MADFGSIAARLRGLADRVSGAAAADAGRAWAQRGAAEHQRRVMEAYLSQKVPEITAEQFRAMTPERLAETYIKYGGDVEDLTKAGAHTESIASAVRNATAQPSQARAGSLRDRVLARRYKGTPESQALEQAIRDAVTPVVLPNGQTSGGGLASVSAAQALEGKLDTPEAVAAMRDLALKYGIQNPDAVSLDDIRDTIASRMYAEAISGRTAANDVFADDYGRQHAQAPEDIPDRDGPSPAGVVPYVPLKVVSEEDVPAAATNRVTGEPLMQDIATPIPAVAGHGTAIDQLPITEKRTTTRYYASIPDASGNVTPDMSKELTLLVRRRSGSDGNRSDAERMWVLPLGGDRFQVLDGSGNRSIASPKYLQSAVNTGGWVHAAGPEIVRPADGGWTPERAENLGRALFEYTRPGAGTNAANLARVVEELDTLGLPEFGDGQLLRAALTEAGGGRLSDGAELYKSAQNAVDSMSADAGKSGVRQAGVMAATSRLDPVPTGETRAPAPIQKDTARTDAIDRQATGRAWSQYRRDAGLSVLPPASDAALARVDEQLPKLGITTPSGSLEIGGGQIPGSAADTLYGPSSLRASGDAIAPIGVGSDGGSEARLRRLAQYLKAPQMPVDRAGALEFQAYLDDLSRAMEAQTGERIPLSFPEPQLQRYTEGGVLNDNAASRYRAGPAFTPEQQAAVMAQARLQEAARSALEATSRGNAQARAGAGQEIGTVSSGASGEQFFAKPPVLGPNGSFVNGTSVTTSPILDAAADGSTTPRYDVLDALRSGSSSFSGAMPFTTVDGTWAANAGRVRPDLEKLLQASRNDALGNFVVDTTQHPAASPSEIARDIMNATASGAIDPTVAERWARYGIPNGTYSLPSLAHTADNPTFSSQLLVNAPQFSGKPTAGAVRRSADGRGVELMPSGSAMEGGSSLLQQQLNSASPASPTLGGVLDDSDILATARQQAANEDLRLSRPFVYADRVRAARAGEPVTMQPEPVTMQREADRTADIAALEAKRQHATEVRRALQSRVEPADRALLQLEADQAELNVVGDMLNLIANGDATPGASIKNLPSYAKLTDPAARGRIATDDVGELRDMRDALLQRIRAADAVINAPDVLEARAALESMRPAQLPAPDRKRSAMQRIADAPEGPRDEPRLRSEAALEEQHRNDQLLTLAENPNPLRYSAPDVPLSDVARTWSQVIGTNSSGRVTRQESFNLFDALVREAVPAGDEKRLRMGRFVRIPDAAAAALGRRTAVSAAGPRRPVSDVAGVRAELGRRLAAAGKKGGVDEWIVPKQVADSLLPGAAPKRERGLPLAFAEEGREAGQRPSREAVEQLREMEDRVSSISDPEQRAIARAELAARAQLFSGGTRASVARSPLDARHRVVRALLDPNQGQGRSVTTNITGALEDLFKDDFSSGLANLQRWDASGHAGGIEDLIYRVLSDDGWARETLPPDALREKARMLAAQAREAFATSATPTDASARLARGFVADDPPGLSGPERSVPQSRIGEFVQRVRDFLRPRDSSRAAAPFEYTTPMDSLYGRLPSEQDIATATPQQLEQHLASVESAAVEAANTAAGTGGAYTGADISPEDIATFMQRIESLRKDIAKRMEPPAVLPEPGGFKPDKPFTPSRKPAPAAGSLDDGAIDPPQILSGSARRGHAAAASWTAQLQEAARANNAGLKAQLNRQRPVTVRMRPEDVQSLFEVYRDPSNLFGSAEPGTVRVAGAPKWSIERGNGGEVTVSASRRLSVSGKAVEPSRSAPATLVEDWDEPVSPGYVHVDFDQNGNPVAFHEGSRVSDARGARRAPDMTAEEAAARLSGSRQQAASPQSRSAQPVEAAPTETRKVESAQGTARGPETEAPPADPTGRTDAQPEADRPAPESRSSAPGDARPRETSDTPAGGGRQRSKFLTRKNAVKTGVGALALYGAGEGLRTYGPDVSGLLGGTAYAGGAMPSDAPSEPAGDTKQGEGRIEDRIRRARRLGYLTTQNPFPRS